MNLEVLRIIVMLCNINSLEDKKSRWTELQVVEKYQRDCRIWYIDCYEKTSGFTYDKLTKCIKQRDPK